MYDGRVSCILNDQLVLFASTSVHLSYNAFIIP